ncbi:hypothetical protein D3C86_728750 [compost metagenome]
MASLIVVQGRPVACSISRFSWRAKARPRKKLSEVPMRETALAPSSFSASALPMTESITSV